MCKTKAEGGRCAAHLRQQISSAQDSAQQAERNLAQANGACRADPESRETFRAHRSATVARDDAQGKVQALQAEYDSTATGQRELTSRIENTPQGPERTNLEARQFRGAQLRQTYRDTAAHKEVADGLRDRDVQHDTIRHDAQGTTISLPSDPGRSHEISIHADTTQPEASRYSVIATTAYQDENGAWNDEQTTPPGADGRMSKEDAIDHAVSYSRDHMPSQSDHDRAESTKSLRAAGIPADQIQGGDTGRVRVSLPVKDDYYRRDITVTPHHEQDGPAKFTATYTESLRDDDGSWAPATFHPVPRAEQSENGTSNGYRTREEAVRDVAAYTRNEEGPGWGSQATPDPWGLSSTAVNTQEYDPAPF